MRTGFPARDRGNAARLSDDAGMDELDLLDWKRRVFSLYADVRAAAEPDQAWRRWRAARDELFEAHPQSPLPAARREAFGGLPYFDYDPALRALADLSPASGDRLAIGSSGDEAILFRHFATARFELGGETLELGVYWLEAYGGGVFLPFADSTRGWETYGGGRYLLDTVKGADLGLQDGRLVLDFNFAYNPSCAYDPRWVCPLTPPQNRLEVPVRGGERI
jgi:uncharacterized protein (DUF1684 family)